jgi:signal transduction histidine kinase/CheY-like chemotaxis protein
VREQNGALPGHDGQEVMADAQRALAFGRRIKVGFVLFSMGLLAALSGMVFLLVAQIFDSLTPSLRDDLTWKAEQGAIGLSHEADLGIVTKDRAMIDRAAGRYERDRDVRAIIVENTEGQLLFRHGKTALTRASLFAGKPGHATRVGDDLVAFGEARIEGVLLGRTALVISTERMVAGDRLRDRILLVAAVGCLLSFVLSLAFVSLYVGPLLSITHRALERLSETTAQALEAARLKSEFLTNMSHEIRTPMNGVFAMTDLLLRTSLDARQRRFAETVRASARSLLTVINDILDFSKIEAGRYQLSPSDFDVRLLMREILELLAPRTQGKPVEIAYVVRQEVPGIIRADADRFKQVLMNLLGNAVKFTERGEIVLTLEVAEQAEGRALLRCLVRDTGVGIAEDDVGRLFTSFTQVDGSSTRRYGGTGLGLVISRRLAQLMGGDVAVESTLGAGSTFVFSARVGVVSAHPMRTLSAAGESVLLVDDSQLLCSLLCTQLASWGVHCEAVSAAGEALLMIEERLIEGRTFASVLIDAALPERSGLELAKAVLKSPEPLPVVLLSPSSSFERPADLSGAFVLPKPIHEAELFDTLTRAFRSEVAARDSVRPSSLTPSEPLKLRGHVLAVDDNEINRNVAGELLRELGLTLDMAENGLEAVEAVKRRHYDAVLMDCQMPVMDGYEATRAIRAWELSQHKPRMPILALTAHALSGERDRVLMAGMDDYMTKPVPARALEVTLARWLAPSGKPVDEGARAPSTPTEGEELARAHVHPLLLPDNDVTSEPATDYLLDPATRRSEKVIALFLRLVPGQIESLLAAVHAQASEELRLCSHKLKGSCASLGARAMADLCQAIQQDAELGDTTHAERYAQRIAQLFVPTARLLEQERAHKATP